MMEIKKPKGEIVWTSYYDVNHKISFLLSSKPTREYYILYEVLCDGNLKRLGRARTPTELEQKHKVVETIYKSRKL